MVFAYSDKVELAVLKRNVADNTQDISDLVESIESLKETVVKIEKLLSHSAGFVGGVAFAFSLIGAAIALFFGYIFKLKTGN